MQKQIETQANRERKSERKREMGEGEEEGRRGRGSVGEIETEREGWIARARSLSGIAEHQRPRITKVPGVGFLQFIAFIGLIEASRCYAIMRECGGARANEQEKERYFEWQVERERDIEG